MTRIQQLDQGTGELLPYYSLGATYILWFFLGLLGGHWFYMGKPKIGTLYLFTCGLFGIGWLLDGINIPSLIRLKNSGH